MKDYLKPEDIPKVPWPMPAMNIVTAISADRPYNKPGSKVMGDEGYDPYYIVEPIEGVFPEGITELNDEDGIRVFAFSELNRLPSEEKDRAIDWALKLLPYVPWEERVEYLPRLYSAIKESPNAAELFSQVWDFAYNHAGEYSYTIKDTPYYSKENPSFIDDLFSFEGIIHLDVPVLTSLADIQDEKKRKVLLGMLIDDRSYASALEGVRNLLNQDDVKVKPEMKAKLERLGKMLYGFSPDDPRPFPRSIEDFYTRFHMEEEARTHDPHSRDTEVNAVIELIQESTSAEVRWVDLASGTDESLIAVAKKMSEIDPNRKVQYVGVDLTPANAVTAEKFQRENGITIQHIIGSWNETDLPEASAEIVSVLGRSIHHANERSRRTIYREAAWLLSKGGTLLFDIADANSGIYRTNRDNYINFLKSLEIPIEQFDEKVIRRMNENLVDSPDNINFMNRFMPHLEEVKRELEEAGFVNIRVVRRNEIANTNGGIDLYIAAERSDKDIYELFPGIRFRETMTKLQNKAA
jgi:ubiquinone/menaquinone biosynthesis C-methylase UbiE